MPNTYFIFWSCSMLYGSFNVTRDANLSCLIVEVNEVFLLSFMFLCPPLVVTWHISPVLEKIKHLRHGHRPLTTDHWPLTTDHWPLTTDHRPPTTDHQPPPWKIQLIEVSLWKFSSKNIFGYAQHAYDGCKTPVVYNQLIRVQITWNAVALPKTIKKWFIR